MFCSTLHALKLALRPFPRRKRSAPQSSARLIPLTLAVLLACLVTVTPVGIGAQAAPRSAFEKPEPKESKKPQKADEPLTEDSEVRMGREAAEENDKQVKLVTDAAIVERVNRIGQEIAAVANRVPIPATWGSSQLKQFKYSFKVVDEKDVNAYSLPGGFIYINRGLLDFARSDDELAGVLAHEIVHAAHHHMVKLIREKSKLDRILIPLQLLAMIGMMSSRNANTAQDAQALMLGAQLFSIAKLSGYGIEAEKDADGAALRLLTHTKYNPVGLYSFMLRLARQEQRKGSVDMGIYRTHPPSPERAEAAKNLLAELNIPIRLSEVDPMLRATITVAKSGVNGAELAEIKMRDIVFLRVTGTETQTAQQRAEKLAERLNQLVDAKLQPFEIKMTRDQSKVLARGFPVLTAADAQAQQKPLSALAREMSDAVSLFYLKQQIDFGI